MSLEAETTWEAELTWCRGYLRGQLDQWDVFLGLFPLPWRTAHAERGVLPFHHPILATTASGPHSGHPWTQSQESDDAVQGRTGQLPPPCSKWLVL